MKACQTSELKLKTERKSYLPRIRQRFVPQAGHFPFIARRPFLSVSSFPPCMSTFFRHFTQYASTLTPFFWILPGFGNYNTPLGPVKRPAFTRLFVSTSARSSLRRRFFQPKPFEKPPRPPSLRTMRWQGIRMGSRFFPRIFPIKRTARGLPVRRAKNW